MKTQLDFNYEIDKAFNYNIIMPKLNKEDLIMNRPFQAYMPVNHDTTQGLKQLEAAYIEYIYELSKYNQSKAAKMLGISRGALRYKLKEYFNDKYI